jgi:hypothetical protein
MTKLKELLEIAKAELSDLTSVPNPDFRLEQAEFNKREKEWEIVVSFLVPNTNKRQLPIAAAIASEFQFYRLYKKIKIDDNNKVVGLYIFNNKE